jgi:hypothetical protein
MIADACDPCLAGTTGAAVIRIVRFDPVADHLTAAVRANRGKHVYGTFEAIEYVTASRRDDLE